MGCLIFMVILRRFRRFNFTTFFNEQKTQGSYFWPNFLFLNSFCLSLDSNLRFKTMSRLVQKTVLIDDSDIDLFIQRRFLEVYEFSKQLLFYKSAGEALNWLRKLNGEAP